MQGNSDSQPNDEDEPTSLSHSDLPQQNHTVDLPNTQEDVVSKYLFLGMIAA